MPFSSGARVSGALLRLASLCGQIFGLGRGHGRLPLGYLRPGKLGLRFTRVLCSETARRPFPLIWQTSKSKGTLVLEAEVRAEHGCKVLPQ